MHIELNGEIREVLDNISLENLIASLGMSDKRYAIEVNEELIPRSEHLDYSLKEGDRVEVVQAIGGG